MLFFVMIDEYRGGSMRDSTLEAVFARHGISDPRKFLDETADNEEVTRSVAAEVQARGSVFLILGKVVKRSDLVLRAAKLKYA